MLNQSASAKGFLWQSCKLRRFPQRSFARFENQVTIDLKISEADPEVFTSQSQLIKRTRTMGTNTIRLHRVLRATPERVYRAFLDADAQVKWLPPNGFTGKVHHMDAKVGGTHKMSFTNFTTGKGHSFGGTYIELKPHTLIRYTDKFEDPRSEEHTSELQSLRHLV